MVSSCEKPIAVLIPVWNRQEKLERALGSLVPEAAIVHVVVIDDGSDPPVRIPSALPMDIHLVRLPSQRGIATALNAGLEYVFGSAIPYIGRLDSDDVALAGRFRRQLDFMERNPSVGICGGSYQECTPDGRLGAVIRLPGSDAGIRRGMHLRTTLWHPTVLIRTAVARQVGLFDPALACEDVDYFLRILDISRGANVSDAVIIYETGAADALTGTASRRRTLARDLLRLKWHRRAPFDPFWWLGLLALGSYTLGINRQLPVLRAMVLRALDRKAI